MRSEKRGPRNRSERRRRHKRSKMRRKVRNATLKLLSRKRSETVRLIGMLVDMAIADLDSRLLAPRNDGQQ